VKKLLDEEAEFADVKIERENNNEEGEGVHLKIEIKKDKSSGDANE